MTWEHAKAFAARLRPSLGDRLTKILFASALLVVAALGFCEVVASPGTVARRYLSAAPSIDVRTRPTLDEVRPQRPSVELPGRASVTVDRHTLDDALRDLRAAKQSVDAALQTLVDVGHAKLDVFH